MQMIVALTVQLIFVALYSVAIPQSKGAWMAFQFFGQGCFGMITREYTHPKTCLRLPRILHLLVVPILLVC